MTKKGEIMTEVILTPEAVKMASEAAVDVLMEKFVPALLNAGVTKEQIREALALLKQAHDNA